MALVLYIVAKAIQRWTYTQYSYFWSSQWWKRYSCDIYLTVNSLYTTTIILFSLGTCRFSSFYWKLTSQWPFLFCGDTRNGGYMLFFTSNFLLFALFLCKLYCICVFCDAELMSSLFHFSYIRKRKKKYLFISSFER